MRTPKNEVDSALLEASLEHWRSMREDRSCGHRPSSRECALCGEYFADNCKGCPVHRFTGRQYCVGTGYATAKRAFDEATHSEWQHAADVMIEQLEHIKKLVDSGKLPE